MTIHEEQPLSAVAIANSRLAVIVVWAFLLILTVVLQTRSSLLQVINLLIDDVPLTLTWFLSAGLFGATIMRRIRTHASWALRAGSSLGLGLGIIGFLILFLGLRGMLSQMSVQVILFGALVIGSIDLLWSHREKTGRDVFALLRIQLLAPAGLGWFWVATAPFAAFALVGATIRPGWLWKPDDPHPYDVMSYHLQIPREWFESGRISGLTHNVFSYFPFNVEMHYLGLMHLVNSPWRAMYAAQLCSLAYAAATALCLRGALEERRGALAGTICSCIPWTAMLACVCYVETGLMFYTSLAAAWALRAIDQNRRTNSVIGSLTLCGIFAGFACGTKYTAVPMVLGAICVSIVIVMRNRPVFLGAGAMVIACGVLLSPWLVRNWEWTGNPVFPLAMETLGKGHFTIRQVDRFEKAHSPTMEQNSPRGRLLAAHEQLGMNWKYAYALWPMALISAIVGGKHRRTQFLFLVLACMFLVWLLATHLQGRFLAPAIPIAALLIAEVERSLRAAIVGIVIGACAYCALSGGVEPMLENQIQALTMRDGTSLIHLPDFRMTQPEILDEWEKSGEVLYLVGGSQLFSYPANMARLRYRTPFDVADIPGADALQMWLGPGIDRNKVWMLIDAAELQRLSDTYHTPIPPQAVGRSDYFVIPPGSFPGEPKPPAE